MLLFARFEMYTHWIAVLPSVQVPTGKHELTRISSIGALLLGYCFSTKQCYQFFFSLNAHILFA